LLKNQDRLVDQSMAVLVGLVEIVQELFDLGGK
jgi:hypothetical protein